jgi:hypothetical protein
MEEMEFTGSSSSREVAAGAAVQIQQPPRHQQSSILSDPENWEMSVEFRDILARQKTKGTYVSILYIRTICGLVY